jgi:hypothetical protein
MEKTAYQTARWRELPRSHCLVEVLFGDAAGPCSGLIHRHHVDPEDALSRTFECCAGHHPTVHAALRVILHPTWRRCPHKPGTHRYPGAREACERNLNRDRMVA